MFNDATLKLAERLLAACEAHGVMLAVAESCTGGLIAALLTEVPGSSAVFERGFITYSNLAKQELLGVDEALIARHGAVSREVAEAMAQGALAQSKAAISLSVTGVAGPGGGTEQKPVGLIYIGAARKKTGSGAAALDVREYRFTGSRQEIRLEAVTAALKQALALL